MLVSSDRSRSVERTEWQEGAAGGAYPFCRHEITSG